MTAATLKELIAKATSGNTLERTAARLNLADALVENAPAIAELIEAAEAVGAHPFIYFGTDTLPGPDSGQHKIAALRKALDAMK